MKQTAFNALDAALRHGASYADVRLQQSRNRALSTKNGRVGHVAASETVGLGVRVIAEGCWGFAATDDLSAEGLESAARLAVEIAHASAKTKEREIDLAPEQVRSHGREFATCFFRLRLTAASCVSLRVPSSAPVGSFHPTRFCPCWAHWGSLSGCGLVLSRPR